MENSFNNRGDFEQYVKRNADQYRMIPSEKVWKGINNILHTRRKWYGLGLSLLLLLTAVAVTWVMLSYPVSKKQENLSGNTPPILPSATEEAAEPVSDISNILSINKYNKQSAVQSVSSPSLVIPINNAIGEGTTEDNASARSLVETILNKESEYNHIQVIAAGRSVKASTSDKPEEIAGFVTNDLIDKNKAVDVPFITGATLLVDKSAEKSQKEIAKESYTDYPLSIESVVNSYHPKKMNKNLIWQLHFAPTISYRKLSQNKSFQNSPPFNPSSYPFSSLTDVNREVTHKPDMGLELGVATKYPLTRNLRLTGGLQFNINRYDIKAFIYNSGEQATIDLNDDAVNDVPAWTHYRNYKGSSKSDWLKNFYLTVSAPIGAELTLVRSKKTNFGIAGTVQPTYILSDRAYLISTDYKNYAEVPWLIRHVNVNTSFEAFINYSNSRGVRWQIGPQVRYQVLSSFQNKYPVKENLFDFGLKVGIMLNQ